MFRQEQIRWLCCNGPIQPLYDLTRSSDTASLKSLKVLYLRSDVMFQVTSIRRTTPRAAHQPHHSLHDKDGFRDQHFWNYPLTVGRLLSQLATLIQLIQKSRRSAGLDLSPQNVRIEYTNYDCSIGLQSSSSHCRLAASIRVELPCWSWENWPSLSQCTGDSIVDRADHHLRPAQFLLSWVGHHPK